MQGMAYQPSHFSNSEDKCQINAPCRDNGPSDGHPGPPISPHLTPSLRLQKNRGELPQLKGTTTNAMWMAM